MPKISPARKEERRQQILHAAIACFAKRGFRETTIQDICAEAGLSTGAVYSYYRSKDAIIEALAEQGRRIAAERSRNGAKPSEAGLESYLREFQMTGTAKFNQFDLRVWADAIGNRQLRDIYLRSRAEAIRTLTSLVAPAAARQGLDVEPLAELVLAIIVGCETRKAIQPSADIMPVIDALLALLAKAGAKRPG